MEGDIVTLQDLFVFDYKAGQDENGKFLGGLVSTGLRPRFLETLAAAGVAAPTESFGSVPGVRR
jgi:pilus assembly protein CpaF